MSELLLRKCAFLEALQNLHARIFLGENKKMKVSTSVKVTPDAF